MHRTVYAFYRGSRSAACAAGAASLDDEQFSSSSSTCTERLFDGASESPNFLKWLDGLLFRHPDEPPTGAHTIHTPACAYAAPDRASDTAPSTSASLTLMMRLPMVHMDCRPASSRRSPNEDPLHPDDQARACGDCNWITVRHNNNKFKPRALGPRATYLSGPSSCPTLTTNRGPRPLVGSFSRLLRSPLKSSGSTIAPSKVLPRPRDAPEWKE